MADIPNDPARRYPYDSIKRVSDEPLALINRHEVEDDRSHIPGFARRLLGHLRDASMSRDTGKESPYDNLRPIKVEGKDQVLFVLFDAYRDPLGYMAVDVIGEPKLDMAILAAMTATVERTDDEQLRQVLRLVGLPLTPSVIDRGADALESLIVRDSSKLGGYSADTEDLRRNLLSEENGVLNVVSTLYTLEYAVALLRYYRPGFDDLSGEEQIELIEAACKYFRRFLQSVRKLRDFLEDVPTNRNQEQVVTQRQRDVRAALLNDVDGLTHGQIGVLLNVPVPDTSKVKGGHVTVKQMVARGRGILEEAFGKEGWLTRAEAMRVEQTQWWSLSPEERREQAAAEVLAYTEGISFEEARRKIDTDSSLRGHFKMQFLLVQHSHPYKHLAEAVEQIKRRT